MKFIVTGSEGFIGKALVKELQRKGAEVIGVDRKNPEHYPDAPNEAADIYRLIENDDDIYGVYHLAAQTSVFNEDNEAIVRDNISVFQKIADLCRAHNVKLVYASSSTANRCNTSSLYGISKRFDEEYAAIYCPKATGVRLHNVYGPQPRQGTLLWHLMNDGTVKLYNRGANVRHFTYIDDVVQGLIYAFGCNLPLINVANPQLTRVAEFADIAAQYIDIDIECVMDKRDRDHFEQAVDENIFTVPMAYTTVEDGLRRVFTGQ